jgi:hypothetical protein
MSKDEKQRKGKCRFTIDEMLDHQRPRVSRKSGYWYRPSGEPRAIGQISHSYVMNHKRQERLARASKAN